MTDEARFGQYLLDRRLAVGGMAEVFLARLEGPSGFQKPVVIKRILPACTAEPEYVKMFLDEARLAGRFNHPNLIHVYQLIEADGQYGLVMEYVEGVDLGRALDACLERDRNVPLDLAAHIIAEAAEGLHHAHEVANDAGELLGVVHRDISPGNLIATWNGTIKVVDFGIAKHKEASSKTQSGVLKGKFSYMSPEQANGLPLDRRSDVFSLGTVLYEMLTLTRCFTRATPFETVEAIVRGDYRPVRSYRSDVPAELEQILDTMLELESSKRYATVWETARDLRRFAVEQGLPGAGDVSRFLHGLFREEERTEICRYMPISEEQMVLVDDEHTAPTDVIDEATHRKLMAALKELRGADMLSGDSETATTQIVRGQIWADVARPNGGTTDTVRQAPDAVPALVYADTDRDPGIVPPVTREVPPPPASDTTEQLVLAETVRGQAYTRRPSTPVLVTVIFVPIILGLAIAIGIVLRQRSTPQATPVIPIVLDSTPVPVTAAPVPDPPRSRAELATKPGSTPATPVEPASTTDPATRTETRSGPTIRPEAARTDSPSRSEALARAASASRPEPAERAADKARAKRLSAHGKVSLTSEPATEVLIDGKRAGRTPLRHHRLRAGRHKVRFENRSLGLARTVELTVAGGQTSSKHVTFGRGRVVLMITPWADVYLRGKKVTQALPAGVLELYEGEHVLELRCPDLDRPPVRRPVRVQAGKTQKVVVNLE